MSELILNAVTALVSSLPFAYGINFCLTPKKRSIGFFLLTLLISFCGFSAKILAENLFGVKAIFSIFILAYQFITFFILTNESKKTIIKFYLFLTMSTTLCEFICMLSFNIAGGKFSHNPVPISGEVRLYSSFVFVILIFIAVLVWQKIHKVQIYTHNIQFFAAFFTQFFITSVFSYRLATHGSPTISVLSAVVLFAISWIITDIFFIKSVYDNHRKAQLKMSLEQASRMEKMQYDYYRSLTESITSLRRFRHDMNNTLQTLSLVMRDPQSFADSRELFSQLSEKYEQIKLPYYCSNPVINAVIFAKSSTAKEKGVRLNAVVKLGEEEGFENIDLCSIFSNMLDNALAASGENDLVELSAWSEAGYLYIKCENPYSGKLVKTAKGYASTKGDSHGLGLSIIENIAKKYDGRMMIDDKDKFKILVTLKIKATA